MVFDTALLILRVRGQEELIDLGRPIDVSDYPVVGVVGITKSESVSKYILA